MTQNLFPATRIGANIRDRLCRGPSPVLVRTAATGVPQSGFRPTCGDKGSPDRSNVSRLPMGWSAGLPDSTKTPFRQALVPIPVPVPFTLRAPRTAHGQPVTCGHTPTTFHTRQSPTAPRLGDRGTA